MVLKISMNEKQNNMNFFKLYLKNNSLNNLLLILFSVISAYLGYAISQKLKTVFNFISVKGDFKYYIFSVSLMYLGLFVLNLLLNWFQNQASFKGNRNILLFSTNKLLRTDYSYFVNDSTNKILADVGALPSNIASFSNSIIMIISNLIQFAVYFIIIFNVSPYAAISTIIFLPIIPLSTLGLNKKLSKKQDDFRKENNVAFAQSLEVLSLCKNIKAKNREDFFLNQLEDKFNNANKSMIKFSAYESYCDNIILLISSLAPILVIYIIVTFIFKDALKREEIIILYLFIPLFLSSFQRIYDCVLQFFKTKPYINKFKKYSGLSTEHTGTIKLNSFQSLTTKGLNVTLPNDKILRIPDIAINKGDKVLIKGESGIGKSTLFNIILGLRTDYRGTVKLNGIDIKKLDIDSVRKVIGISFQSNGVYSMSIEDNIKLGNESNIDSIINMVELNNLLKDKKDSVISLNTISGGEKSRISMAQSLCQKPEVILIDESTTSLDEGMEDRVLNNITRALTKETILCISHRKSTEKYFNKIVSF